MKRTGGFFYLHDMKNTPISLSALCAAVGVMFASACQSPSRPNPPAVVPVTVTQDNSEYLDLVTDVVLAFETSRKNPDMARKISVVEGSQVKLLSREFPIVEGDINGDSTLDVFAPFAVQTPHEELLQYAVFLRNHGKLRMVDVLPRAGKDTGTLLTLTAVAGDRLVWGTEGETGKDPIWKVKYKWSENELQEAARDVLPPSTAKR